MFVLQGHAVGLEKLCIKIEIYSGIYTSVCLYVSMYAVCECGVGCDK